MKLIKSLSNCYNKLSNYGKLLIIVTLLLAVIGIFRVLNPVKEGFVEQSKYLFKTDSDVYDDFYASVYDYLVFNKVRNDFEVEVIINSAGQNDQSIIADIGCGTGHLVSSLNSKNINITGIDLSPSMIKQAKEQNPHHKNNYKTGNALDRYLFMDGSLTHILCLYFTIYCMKDKMLFFNNCMNWLMPGGFLIVHLVDKYNFTPLIPVDNPLYAVSSSKDTKGKITTRKLAFKDFEYNANFRMASDSDIATIDEKFKFNNGSVRKQEQVLFIEDLPTIVNMAQDAGFLLHAKYDMIKCAYEYQFIYVFVKPN